MNKLFGFIILLLTLIIGFVIGCVFSQWSFISPKYFETKLTDLVNVSITILIAFFIYVYLNRISSHDKKRRELVVGIYDTLQNTLEIVYNVGNEYIESDRSFVKQQTIVSNIKKANMTISLIRSMDNNVRLRRVNRFNHTIQGDLLDLKKSLTDFPDIDKPYSPQSIHIFHTKYQSTYEKILQCKINVYS